MKNRYATDTAYCEECKKRSREKYRALRYNEESVLKEKERGKQRWRNSTSVQRLGLLIRGARSNLRRFDKQTPFTITASDFVIPEFCPVLGIPLFFGGPPFSPNTPSLDRLIPKLGYTKENVRIISWRANRLKADCTNPSELRAIADYLEDNLVDLLVF